MKLSRKFRAALAAAIVVLGLAGGAERSGAVPGIGYAWTGWREVPGNAVTVDSISGLMFTPERLLYLFIRGADDRVYYQTTFKSDFSGWIEVPGGGVTDAAPSAVIFQNQIYLFVKGLDGRIYVNIKAAFGGWSGWFWFVDHPTAFTGPMALSGTLTMYVAFGTTSLDVAILTWASGTWRVERTPQLCVDATPTLYGNTGGLGVLAGGCAGTGHGIFGSQRRPDGTWTGWVRDSWNSDAGCGFAFFRTRVFGMGGARDRGWLIFKGLADDRIYTYCAWPMSPPPLAMAENAEELPGGGTTDCAPTIVGLGQFSRRLWTVALVKGKTDGRVYWNIGKSTPL